jgi:hypothetical protein
MPKERLQELLKELRNEIEGREALDDESMRLLSELQVEVEDVLEQTAAPDPPTLSERLRELRSSLDSSVERLERSHPNLVTTIQAVATAMRGAGF